MCEARYISIGHLLKSNPKKYFRIKDIMQMDLYGVTPNSIRRELISLVREGYAIHNLYNNSFRWSR